MKRIFFCLSVIQLSGALAFGAGLQERAGIFLFADQHANPTLVRRYETITKKLMVEEGKDPSLFATVMVDQVQPGILECFPRHHISPRISRLNIVSKNGQNVACYTDETRDWPSDSQIRDLIRGL